jgi:alkylhydroperoxidase family enzyme
MGPVAQQMSRPIVLLLLFVSLEALFSVPSLAWGTVPGLAVAAVAATLLWIGRQRCAGLLTRLAARLERVPHRVWIGSVVVVGILLRIVWARVFPAAPDAGGPIYTQLAARLTHGEAYQTPGTATWAEWPPGYPLLLTATFLIGGINAGSVMLLNLVLFAGTLVATDALARRIAGEGPARIATLLLALWPNLIATAGLAAKELLLAFLITTALTVWLDARATSSAATAAGAWLAAGFALGLASLTHPGLLLFPAVLVAADLLAGPLSLRTLSSWVLLVLGLALPVAPWTLRNERIFHRPILVSTNGGGVLYRATGAETGPGEHDLNALTELKAEDAGWRRARAWIRRNPGRFAALAGGKQLRFLGDDATGVRLTLSNGGRLQAVLIRLANVWWWALWLPILLALFAWRSPSPPSSAALLLMLAVLYFWLLDSVFGGSVRHHVPLAGVLAALAGMAFAARVPRPGSAGTPHYPAKVVKTIQALLKRPASSPPALRQAVLARAEQLAEHAPAVEAIPAELTTYLDQVVFHAERTTEADVQQLKDKGYSEDQILELTLCAALGAGLARLNRGLAALQGEK